MPNAATKLKQLINERRPKGERWHGVTGDFDGTVDVADKPGFVYVRIPKGNGYEVGVFAGSANTAGMAVEIEQDPITGQRRVMNTDAQGVAYNGGGTIDYDPTAYAFTPHHARHELGGDDEVNIYSAQILPLQPTVTGTTAPRSITVSAGLYQIAGISYIKQTSSAKGLTSYYPASGVKYVWLLINAAGTLSVQDDGATVYGALVQPSNEYFIIAIIQCRGGYGIAVADILDHRYHQPILPKLARGSVVAATAVMWGALDNSTSGNVLVGNGADIISTAVAGDATFTSAGTLTLASITTAGTFGDATHVARVTIDVKGRVTTATEVVITGALVGAHDILSTSHSDTTTAAVVRGDLMTGQGSTAAWARLALGGASGSVVSRNADDVLWSGFHLAGTAGQTYTFPAAGGTIPTGTGAATRVAYWTGANTVGSDADLTWDAATGILTINRDHSTEQAQIILKNNVGGGRIRGVLTGEIEFASLDGLTTWGSVFASGIWSSGGRFMGDSGTLNIQGIASGKVLFLSCADTYTLTIPATGTVALLGTANVFTATQTISNAAPIFVMTDTTGGAKGLTIAVDANVADFRESAGASGSLLLLDLANNRIGVGVTAPAYPFDSTGILRAQSNILVKATGSNGCIQLSSGDATHTGCMEWRLAAIDGAVGTRLGYMGYGTANITLGLENSANFIVSGGSLTVSTGFGCNAKAAQTAYASGGAVAPGAGAFGASSAANFAALATLVANIRLALVANGIMS